MIASNPLPQRMKMTLDEFLAADSPEGHRDELPEGYRYELVEGEIEVSCMPGFSHDAVVLKLTTLFIVYRNAHPVRIGHLSTHACVASRSQRTARVPDYAVYGPIPPHTGEPDWCRLRPMLVVEVVSEDSARVDYVNKRRDYWEAGVPEYWIADRGRGTIAVLRRGEQDWQQEVYASGQVYRPAAFPGLEVDVAQLLEE